MEQNEIIAQLRTTLYDVKPQISAAIANADNFRDDWGLDSLELVEFVARIEQSFKILIPDKDLKELYSLNATATYLRSKMIAA
ncbi:MAG: acyl carrier protein [Chitinophagaceae bacterium]|nr:acyl carrier protein [Chitinophagaceae bacterium]